MIVPLRPISRPLHAIRTPRVAPGWRIGLMGGTFNPPHAGHVAVAETALRRLELDRLWWLVTPGNPLKSHIDLAPLKVRLAAAERLAKSSRIDVTGLEAGLGTPFTATTLAVLKARYPRVHFVWIMGGDNLATFHRWRHWRRIAALMPIAIVDRPGWRFKALASPAAKALARRRIRDADATRLATMRSPAWIYLSTRLSPLSSTGLRQTRR